MKRGVGFVAAWVGATLVAVVVAAAAVGSVRSEVTDEPTALGSPSAAAIASDLPLDADDAEQAEPTAAPSPSEADVTTTVHHATTTTTDGTSVSTSTSSTTTAPQSSTTTITTAPETTTTSQAGSYSKSVDTPGGSVTFLVEGERVTFGGAVPRTGWKVELESAGPEEVKVKFEKNDDSAEIEVKGRVEDGELRINVSNDDD